LAAEPIRYIDRYDGKTKTEKVYGERWLRWAYENPIGRLGVWLLFRRALFSRYYGWRMNRRGSDFLVFAFVGAYGVDISEFEKSPFDFRTFNEFFHRALKAECRPVAPEPGVATLPADGRHLVFPDVGRAEGFYFKGSKFTVAELLGNADLGRRYENGSMLISRLCPSDYHRFHFPVAGTPGEPRKIPGWLYSVNPIALRRSIRYLVENKRLVTIIETEEFGTVVMVEIGATNVGSIVETFIPGRPTAKGAEKGFFAFGGSCVVTLFEPGRIKFEADLARNSALYTETYARMGDRLGSA
jgi:phosphatidylserine decarboxylase